MKKSIATLMLCLLFGCFSSMASADTSHATLQTVRAHGHRATRHRAHKATKHHRPKRQRHAA